MYVIRMIGRKGSYGGNVKQLYDTANKLPGKVKKRERLIRENGNVLLDADEHLSRSIEQFERAAQRTRMLIPQHLETRCATDIMIDCKKTTTEETSMVLAHILLFNNKFRLSGRTSRYNNRSTR